ncbi:sigma-70 family RNA polymerase sigma factor [Gordonia sp. zg691]|uniref:RNA polymerase sigma factor n=1 Tax=Gordonia jinghuaiqii TaxID=2758710 RepID=A0A7D7RAE3_9ACTN|nr:sigma-70 family RNA polymerase sigma factor [Gordonia jinghuaiqii]MBD0860561.1 sigma-70 family RNA polymerase sigma factor [Gordonia jinghuaiqii]MCR5978174.1 sigma-70 family RNA polymerase sigma factor [Gordonia jinghuaiqii]QMT01370.1 sigma-70 family RNA polymerase sigma factor [Gordonia jinghuaiqii]
MTTTTSTAEPDAGLDAEFLRVTEPFRREIVAHCYRMMGSHHDAEDLTQETFLRAWRGYAKFDHRASVRTWLHKIATNTCLTALQSTQRRPLPSGLGGDAFDPADDLLQNHEVPWLEPYSGTADDITPGDDADPAFVVGARESVRLAFIAALQHLPERQRAVLILRDVLQWRAAEVADTIGVTTATVNSLLQRAREQVKNSRPQEDSAESRASVLDDAAKRELLARYVSAFERYDVDAIVEMFTDRAIWEMPPFTGWYQGGESIGTLIRRNCPAEKPGDQILLPTVANGQPAYGLYMREPDGIHRPFQLQVLDIDPRAGKVSHVVAFFSDTMEADFARFGLPATPYDAPARTEASPWH